MITRRGIVLAAPAALAASKQKAFHYADVEARIARRDFKGITKDDLPTPALVVDKIAFDKNLRHMAEHCKATGIDIRAHCKIHKSVNIAKQQIALGSLGICCATIAESELMVAAGIRNVLHTCQPAGKNKISRAVDLGAKDPTFMVVADDPETVDLLNEAAAAAGIRLRTLVDIYAGLSRHGHAAGAPGLAVAQRIDKSKNLVFSGVMGYSGVASHTKGWENRRAQSRKDVGPVVETALLCKKSGLNAAIVTGGSTGTYNIDKEIGLTELQAGSYVFMDTAYNHIGAKAGVERYSDFGTSLHVLTTVISRNHPKQVTIDAGNKALLRPTDQVAGRPEVTVENQGAEFGILKWNDGNGFKLGEKAELITTNLDMTTNCYDRYYVCEGANLVDVWPVMGRAGALQR
ncbi:MAG: DSD1 family PLP-dependent enzyme [Acidobacteria bacterium]|nr:DSD1 family PLP-dependent enzyme [Acidobacteriota bacterium]